MSRESLYDKSYFERTQARTLRKNFVGEMEYLISFSGITAGSSILDVGCGTGSSMRYFKNKGFDNIYGIERSDCAIKTYCAGLNVLRSSSDKLPVKTSSMDFVFMSHVIGHIDDVFSSLREIRRVLKKGGRFAVITPRLLYKMIISVKNLFDGYTPDATVLRFYSGIRLKKDVERHNFKLLRLKALDFETNGMVEKFVKSRLIAFFEAV